MPYVIEKAGFLGLTCNIWMTFPLFFSSPTRAQCSSSIHHTLVHAFTRYPICPIQDQTRDKKKNKKNPEKNIETVAGLHVPILFCSVLSCSVSFAEHQTRRLLLHVFSFSSFLPFPSLLCSFLLHYLPRNEHSVPCFLCRSSLSLPVLVPVTVTCICLPHSE